MKANVFREILQGSYIENNILIYDLRAFEIFEKQFLWVTPLIADLLQILPNEEREIAIRWLKKKKITAWLWSSDVWNKMIKKFNIKVK